MAHSPPVYHNYPPAYPPQHPLPMPYSPPEPHPNKRPRLSPNPTSPYTSPQLTNGSVPNHNFYAPSSTGQAPYMNGINRQNSPPSAQPSPGYNNLAPPAPTPGAMGPPSRPAQNEKPVDVNDLGDVLVGSGVDIREEEAALINRQSNAGQQQAQGSSFGSTQTTSFASTLPNSSPGYFDHPTFGYSNYAPNIPIDKSGFYGAGNFNQAAITPEEFEQQVQRKERETLRKRGEIGQFHMNYPFLEGNPLDQKLRRQAETAGIRVPNHTFAGPAHPQVEYRIFVQGQDGHDKLAVLKEKVPVAPPGGLSDFLSLLSLACKDHLRSVTEQSVYLARGRKATAHGIVPLDLKDIALGQGKAEDAMITMPSPASSLKRSFNEVNADLSTSASQEAPQNSMTFAFPNATANFLNECVDAEDDFEKVRSAKRTKRITANLPGGTSGVTSAVGTPGGPGTPGSQLDKGPTAEPKKPPTKKELKKQAESRQTEADQHKATNQAASLALGGIGGGPSWLKGSGGSKSWLKSGSGANTSFTPPSRTVSAGQKGKGAAPATSSEKRGRKFGGFREDAVGNSDLELRDLIQALELDVKERKALASAYSKLNNTKN